MSALLSPELEELRERCALLSEIEDLRERCAYLERCIDTIKCFADTVPDETWARLAEALYQTGDR